MKIIDCHTHLQSEKLIKEYFANTDREFAVSMQALDSLIGNGVEFWEATKKFDNIFVCPCIDSLLPIKKQLEEIDNLSQHNKIIGIKIYTGYQSIFADDERLTPVFEYAMEKGLSVVYHCGVGAENLESAKGYNYASCLPIAKLAKRYPDVNFIASHFDYPHFDDCAKLILKFDNVYTDISGELENFKNYSNKELADKFICKIKPVLNKYDIDKLSDKVMFGTDYFGKNSGFYAVEEYIYICKSLFGEKNLDKLLFKICLKAYPKIQKFIN